MQEQPPSGPTRREPANAQRKRSIQPTFTPPPAPASPADQAGTDGGPALRPRRAKAAPIVLFQPPDPAQAEQRGGDPDRAAPATAPHPRPAIEVIWDDAPTRGESAPAARKAAPTPPAAPTPRAAEPAGDGPGTGAETGKPTKRTAARKATPTAKKAAPVARKRAGQPAAASAEVPGDAEHTAAQVDGVSDAEPTGPASAAGGTDASPEVLPPARRPAATRARKATTAKATPAKKAAPAKKAPTARKSAPPPARTPGGTTDSRSPLVGRERATGADQGVAPEHAVTAAPGRTTIQPGPENPAAIPGSTTAVPKPGPAVPAELERRDSPIHGPESGRTPGEGWRAVGARVLDHPGFAPELLAVAAVQELGPRARDWAERMRGAYPDAAADGLARLAARRFVRLAGTGGAVAAGAGLLAPVAELAAVLWTQANLVLHLAATYGRDPGHPDRAAELLALTQVHPDVGTARAALDAVRSAGPPGDGAWPRAAEAAWRLATPLAAQAGGWLGLRLASRLLPGAALLIAAVGDSAAAERLAARATVFYRPVRAH